MTKYIKGKDGKFAGSIGDGKADTPAGPPMPPPQRIRNRPTYDTPSVDDQFAAYQQHYFAEDGNYGDAQSLETFDTSRWSEEDWDSIDEAPDSIRVLRARQLDEKYRLLDPSRWSAEEWGYISEAPEPIQILRARELDEIIESVRKREDLARDGLKSTVLSDYPSATKLIVEEEDTNAALNGYPISMIPVRITDASGATLWQQQPHAREETDFFHTMEQFVQDLPPGDVEPSDDDDGLGRRFEVPIAPDQTSPTADSVDF